MSIGSTAAGFDSRTLTFIMVSVCTCDMKLLCNMNVFTFTVIQGRFGTVKKDTKMRSGSLLNEAARPTQAKMILDTTVLLNTEVKATAHRSLNTSEGVIRDYGRDLFEMSESEIVKEMTDQGVQDVSRFILKKDGKEIKTNTYFVTFCMSVPPEKLRIGYYFVEVKRYIPNPLRCFQCLAGNPLQRGVL